MAFTTASTDSRASARWVDRAIGVLLGLALGIAVAYLLVMVVGSDRDTPTIPRSEPAQTAPAERASRPPVSQRR